MQRQFHGLLFFPELSNIWMTCLVIIIHFFMTNYFQLQLQIPKKTTFGTALVHACEAVSHT